MEKKQNTVWKSFKKFINSQRIGEVVTRSQIIRFIEQDTKMQYYGVTTSCLSGKWKDGQFYTNPSFSHNTIDYTRNLAEKLGFLDKTRCRGMCVVSKHFPADYTVSQLRKDYDNRQW